MILIFNANNFFCTSISDIITNNAIGEAIKRMESTGTSGKDITPYLLKEVGKITGNSSLNTSKTSSSGTIWLFLLL